MKIILKNNKTVILRSVSPTKLKKDKNKINYNFFSPVKVLSANRNNKLLFPTPIGRKKTVIISRFKLSLNTNKESSLLLLWLIIPSLRKSLHKLALYSQYGFARNVNMICNMQNNSRNNSPLSPIIRSLKRWSYSRAILKGKYWSLHSVYKSDKRKQKGGRVWFMLRSSCHNKTEYGY